MLFHLRTILVFLIIINLPGCGSDDPVVDEVPPDTIDSMNHKIDLCIDSLDIIRYFGGCNNLFLYNIYNDSVYFTIEIDPLIIDISDTCRYYDITADGILASIQMKGDDPDSVYFNFCSDVIMELGKPIIFSALSGEMTIVSNREQVSDTSTNYRISVLLKDIMFEGIDSSIHKIKYYNILQGWTPPN